MGYMLGLLLLVGAIFWRGYVITWLWDWFVVDLFHLVPLTVMNALGIVVLLNLLLHKKTYRDYVHATRNDDLMYAVSEGMFQFMVPMMALGAGLLIHLCR